MIRAILAVPGPLATRTGGYAYARRLLAAAPGEGLALDHLELPDGFPFPTTEALAETARRVAAAPPGRPLLVDGLAFGVLPPRVLDAARAPLAALVHHPLARETGLDAADAEALRLSEREALARAQVVLCPSRATAEALHEDYAVPGDRLHIAPPGLDRPAAPAPRAAGGGAFHVLCVASLTPRKGQADLVEALARLPDLPWRLTLAGVDRDAAYAGALRAQAAALGVVDRVETTGALDDDALEAAYARADLFCLPSRYEGYGMVYAEAMARGLPVLACDIPAAREVAREAAALVPVGDVEALAGALRRLAADGDERARLAEAGQARAEALPGWDETARRVRDALAPLVSPRAFP